MNEWSASCLALDSLSIICPQELPLKLGGERQLTGETGVGEKINEAHVYNWVVCLRGDSLGERKEEGGRGGGKVDRDFVVRCEEIAKVCQIDWWHRLKL